VGLGSVRSILARQVIDSQVTDLKGCHCNERWVGRITGNEMTQDRYRSIGSLIGLALGIVLMLALGWSGVVPSAVLGAGGCVCGAITGERLYVWHSSRGG